MSGLDRQCLQLQIYKLQFRNNGKRILWIIGTYTNHLSEVRES